MSWDCHNLGGKVNFCARQADLLWEKKAEKCLPHGKCRSLPGFEQSQCHVKEDRKQRAAGDLLSGGPSQAVLSLTQAAYSGRASLTVSAKMAGSS